MLECWSVVAALAAAVPRVGIGTLVCGNTYRHPAVLANQAATADVISGGRVILGLGAGWQVNEHDKYGIDLFVARRAHGPLRGGVPDRPRRCATTTAPTSTASTTSSPTPRWSPSRPARCRS